MKLMKLAVTVSMVILFGLAGSVRAQEPYRLSEKEMKDLLSRIDKQAEVFRGSLKKALDNSRFDETKAEDRINDFVKGFSEATERLKHRYSDKRTASADVEEVLHRAARIDDFMIRHELSPRAEGDWADLRKNLDSLAEAYSVTWSWTEHPRSQDVISLTRDSDSAKGKSAKGKKERMCASIPPR